MKYLLHITVALCLLACSGTNGEDAPTQEELQKQLKSLMKPKKAEDVSLKPDSLSVDSIQADTTK